MRHRGTNVTVKGMVIVTAALMGLAAAAVPASATTITHVHGGSFTAIGKGDALMVDATTTIVDGTTRVTLIDGARRAAPASFAPAPTIPDDLIDRDAVARQARTAGMANTAVSDASILPEAATWAMMLVGFGVIGLGMRYGIRRSNAKFDLKVQRIAAGLEA